MTDDEIGTDAQNALFDEQWVQWIGEAYGASGLGVSGVALFILVTGAVGLFNWSESFRVPVVWLVLMTPLVAVTLPVPVIFRLIGIVTTGVALLFVALWMFWNRT